MPGTVNPIVPLSLLEAVRTLDIPEGDDVEVEYVQEHRNKRLGLSDTVIAQIRRYKEALKRNQQIAIDEASGIARLIGRRPDAEGIFTRAGTIVANRMYQMISATRRQIIHLLPGLLARPLAFRQVKKAGNKYLGASVRRVGSSIVVGIKESARFNNLIVFVKLAVILLFIMGAAKAIKVANWHPFIPQNAGSFGHFGWSGVARGASIVFFAYIGFDAVSTAAQEAKNPRRDMPIGIIGSLLICTLLYIVVSAVATGVVSYQLLDVPDPIAVAADHAGMGWMAALIKLGAIAGLSSVILVMMLGQSRVFWSMSKDGLLPAFFSHIHPRFRTPWITTAITGVVVAVFSALFTVREAGSLVSIGTLLAFIIVSIGVLVLRVREPNLPRSFKTPVVWLVAPLGAAFALYLMICLPWPTWERLILWFGMGMVIYFGYSVNHSKLNATRLPVKPADRA